MKKLSFILAVLAALFLVQCCKKKNTTATTASSGKPLNTVDEPGAEQKVQPIAIRKEYHYKETDQFNIISTRCGGDTLFVEVEYGGGCEQHEFTMISNNLWLKSLPPQLTLYLEHKSNNDMCRALIRTTLAFDLREVRFPGGKEMKLYINNDRSRETIYKY